MRCQPFDYITLCGFYPSGLQRESSPVSLVFTANIRVVKCWWLLGAEAGFQPTARKKQGPSVIWLQAMNSK